MKALREDILGGKNERLADTGDIAKLARLVLALHIERLAGLDETFFELDVLTAPIIDKARLGQLDQGLCDFGWLVLGKIERLEAFVKTRRSGGAQAVPYEWRRTGLARFCVDSPTTPPVVFDKDTQRAVPYSTVQQYGVPAVLASGGGTHGVDISAYGISSGDDSDSDDDRRVLCDLHGLATQFGVARVAPPMEEFPGGVELMPVRHAAAYQYGGGYNSECIYAEPPALVWLRCPAYGNRLSPSAHDAVRAALSGIRHGDLTDRAPLAPLAPLAPPTPVDYNINTVFFYGLELPSDELTAATRFG
ncbi:hypothetical protein CYMTET_28554 [Cymbomonas tetramitiformis]|uniref:Uncharacterized protein n=1 Tax=Cymbomonas tetramitiformis TaxID=36881 RepID=A0AAE0FMW3_9CHLO|nr:hypothetical protein CYMTET_28554 [Cymbomonas tetramitiformis]